MFTVFLVKLGIVSLRYSEMDFSQFVNTVRQCHTYKGLTMYHSLQKQNYVSSTFEYRLGKIQYIYCQLYRQIFTLTKF